MILLQLRAEDQLKPSQADGLLSMVRHPGLLLCHLRKRKFFPPPGLQIPKYPNQTQQKPTSLAICRHVVADPPSRSLEITPHIDFPGIVPLPNLFRMHDRALLKKTRPSSLRYCHFHIPGAASHTDMSTQKELAIESARVLREAGHVVYFAGGAVRDQLLGQTPKDYDLATSARPDEVQALFKKSDAVGEHFGVIIVKGSGEMIEVATFRTDGSYKDGRRPESVEFSSPEQDAQRRDFTINGLFQDPLTGEIIDHVGGRADLEAKVLRAIGDPRKRFEEDALRLLRAIRFSTTTRFEIEAKTWAAIQECAPLLSQISPERIRDEFSRILMAADRARGLDLLVDSGLIKEFLPEVLDLQGCEQPPQWHPEGDVYVHTRIALSLLNSPPLHLALAVLLHDIGKPATQAWDAEAERFRFNGHDKVGASMAEKILRRLRYSNQTVEDVTFMVSRHMQFMHVKDMRTAKLKRFMSAETFELETELHRVDCDSSNGFRDNYDFVRTKKEEFAREPLIPKPLLTGHDLIRDFKIAPGPEIGTILRDVQTEQLEGRLSDKEAAYQFVKETLSQ